MFSARLEDKTVCHWDVNAYSKGNSSTEPLNVFHDHTTVFGGVDWRQVC